MLCGLSETEAKQSNVAHKIYRFPFDEIDRAQAGSNGFAKIATDPKGKPWAPRSSVRMRASSLPSTVLR